mmetsp:Transcript_120269/g.220200  ORF Transcript_120269/g.220200 Transcript_120269/m.220200 type:complete len:157 (+) Transcript_120269:157-627(+)
MYGEGLFPPSPPRGNVPGRRRPMVAGVERTPASRKCGILPGANAMSALNTFGHGSATTKQMPPGAAMRPMSELPDLTPEERFQSTYASSFNAERAGKAACEIDLGKLTEECNSKDMFTSASAFTSTSTNTHFPRRYVPACNHFMRGHMASRYFARP